MLLLLGQPVPPDSSFQIIIEYNYFILGSEFNAVTEVADKAIIQSLLEIVANTENSTPDKDERSAILSLLHLFRKKRGRRNKRKNRKQVAPSLLCISEINKGSITITGILTGAAIQYCYSRFIKGVKKSDVGPQIEALGEAAGNNMGTIIARLNRRLDMLTNKMKKSGSNIKKISAHKGERH